MSVPPGSAFASHFGGAPAGSARAPGRVNLIGEHTDYNGGWVFPAAIELSSYVDVRFRSDLRVCGYSASRGEAEAGLREPARGTWLDYPRGVARVLAERGRLPERGFELLVRGELPEGAGLSSSASLLAATAIALRSAAGLPLRSQDLPELAHTCQRAEAAFVGTPCGVMDPFVSLHAQPAHALLLRCSDLSFRQVPLPEALQLVIVDSGVEHALRTGGYAERARECARALVEAQRLLGIELGNLSALGEEQLGGLEPGLDPLLFRRVRHVVTENARVAAAAHALLATDLEALGTLLYASHESLRLDYAVTCEETDWLVARSREIASVVGARMTGAGWGGCTLHLVRAPDGPRAAQVLADGFRGRFGRRPRNWITRAGSGARVTHAGDGPPLEPDPRSPSAGAG